ncbi:hypothetical protein [Altibacter lentus]|nr:hypothetical protein [Altibacter lentus]MCT8339061.1 hypothetical protein [Thermobacterium salinum]
MVRESGKDFIIVMGERR